MVDQALQAAGNVVGGIAGYEAGKYNRSVSRTMATEEERAGAADEARIRDAARMAIGQQVAAQGSNGFQQGTGSALDALAQSQINAAFDALTVRSEAARRARSRRVEGDIAYAQGSNALVQGMMGAAATGYQMSNDWASARRGTSSGFTVESVSRMNNGALDGRDRYGGGPTSDGKAISLRGG